MEKLYTVKEIADMLQLHEGTIRRWFITGKIKGVKVGKLWYMKESDLKELIDGNGKDS